MDVLNYDKLDCKLLEMKNVLAVFFLLCFIYGSGQNGLRSLGVEFQQYPTGSIPALRADVHLGVKSSIDIRLGANIFDHRDLGVQPQEEGQGFGFSVGYNRFFKATRSGLNLGVRSDVWFNAVDWINDTDSGTTDITVLQPTLTGGYAFLLCDGHVVIQPGLAFGWEVNVRTEGEPTGEGAIILGGIFLGYRW